MNILEVTFFGNKYIVETDSTPNQYACNLLRSQKLNLKRTRKFENSTLHVRECVKYKGKRKPVIGSEAIYT